MPILQAENTAGILLVTLSRPDALNALNVETLENLHKVMQEAYHNSSIRGIILTGDGEKSFVAGADIKELSVLNSEEASILAQKGQSLFSYKIGRASCRERV